MSTIKGPPRQIRYRRLSILKTRGKTESCTIWNIDAMKCYWTLIHRPICGQCSLSVLAPMNSPI